ncbi:hypothetical protein BB561_004446 [Smittium simulii]|uniref:Uncharacterized protein n=1 Tax=Smittium simulii TaxID=133385 RepID=A0A2T9YG79_9FUNG|nr:hypothetical protein BB561_004446 [Smittium simulii]
MVGALAQQKRENMQIIAITTAPKTLPRRNVVSLVLKQLNQVSNSFQKSKQVNTVLNLQSETGADCLENLTPASDFGSG